MAVFVPLATNREVYDPALATANPGALTMQYRVLDPNTSEAKMDSGFKRCTGYVHPGNLVVPVVTRLSVAQLPVGHYRLEVKIVPKAKAFYVH